MYMYTSINTYIHILHTFTISEPIYTAHSNSHSTSHKNQLLCQHLPRCRWKDVHSLPRQQHLTERIRHMCVCGWLRSIGLRLHLDLYTMCSQHFPAGETSLGQRPHSDHRWAGVFCRRRHSSVVPRVWQLHVRLVGQRQPPHLVSERSTRICSVQWLHGHENNTTKKFYQ